MKLWYLLLPMILIPDSLYDSVREIVIEESSAIVGFNIASKTGENGSMAIYYSVRSERQDRSRLVVTVNKVPPEDMEKSWLMMRPSIATDGVNAAFSDLPCGTNARRIDGGRTVSLQTMDGVFLVRVQINYRGGRPTQSVVAADRTIAEGMARRALARCRGLQSQSSTSMNVGGTSVPSITGPRAERLVDLERYCQALNLTLTTNEKLGTASFMQGGELVIIPLSANKIKDGSRWIESSDISLIKNGRWYVSYAALGDAR